MITTLLGSAGIIEDGLRYSHLFTYAFTRQNRRFALDITHELVVYCPPEHINQKSKAATVKKDIAFLKKLSYQKLVLVFYDGTQDLRLYFETLCQENNCYTVTLPFVFGGNVLPQQILGAMAVPVLRQLTPQQYTKLALQSDVIKTAYLMGEKGLYQLQHIEDAAAKKELEQFFIRYLLGENYTLLTGLPLLGAYQFYQLRYLWRDVNIVLLAGQSHTVLAGEPVTPSQLYRAVYGYMWQGKLCAQQCAPILQSDTALICGGKNGFCMPQQQMLQEIAAYMRGHMQQNYF